MRFGTIQRRINVELQREIDRRVNKCRNRRIRHNQMRRDLAEGQPDLEMLRLDL